jgi:large subunit ribosomal protein L10
VTRLEKQAFVEQFSKDCADHSCLFVVRQTALSADAVMTLRRSARASGVVFKVVKNTLAKRALSEKTWGIETAFKGPTGVLMGSDPVAIAKIVDEFSKKREDFFAPLAGVMSGAFLDAASIKRLATLPSMDQLRASLVALIQEPAARLARLTQEPAARLARVTLAYAEKS